MDVDTREMYFKWEERYNQKIEEIESLKEQLSEISTRVYALFLEIERLRQEYHQ